MIPMLLHIILNLALREGDSLDDDPEGETEDSEKSSREIGLGKIDIPR
jgi:hypothetical protein